MNHESSLKYVCACIFTYVLSLNFILAPNIETKKRYTLYKMTDFAKDVEEALPSDSAPIEPQAVPLVMDMVQRSNGNGAAISIVDLVNRTDGEENVVGLIDAPTGNGSGDGDVTNGHEGHKHRSSAATDEVSEGNGESTNTTY